MQYWINHNGVQSGPVDLDALKEMGLTSAAYVWHEGLSDWVKITQLPELQGYYEIVTGNPLPQQPVEAEAPAPPVQEHVETPTGQPYQAPQPAQTYPQGQPQYVTPAQPSEPCPPTNLVWAVISTVLCCLPAGIVAIIYAIKVQNKYREGDIEGAKRASETGAWWCIASIILGILTMPLVSLIQASSLS